MKNVAKLFGALSILAFSCSALAADVYVPALSCKDRQSGDETANLMVKQSDLAAFRALYNQPAGTVANAYIFHQNLGIAKPFSRTYQNVTITKKDGVLLAKAPFNRDAASGEVEFAELILIESDTIAPSILVNLKDSYSYQMPLNCQ